MDTTKNGKKQLGGAAKERERKKNKLNEAAKTCQNIKLFINKKVCIFCNNNIWNYLFNFITFY